ncbi:MAG: hypothetical protein JWM95_1450 [Gemmatimonadetes bacterium]|nr:hypothetical protein [Gemmatimonadota bacterium]
MVHLFVAALLIRVMVLAIPTGAPFDSENLRTGFTLGMHGYFGDPFLKERTGLSAHVAPMYPALIALVYRLTHDVHITQRVLKGIFAIVSALNVAMLIPLARALKLPRGTGAIAGIFWLVPLFVWTELSGTHETIFATLALLLLLTFAFSRVAPDNFTARDGALIGVVAGLAVHVSPLLLPMLAFALAPTFLSGRPWSALPRRFVTFGGAFLLTFLVVILPYTIRNHTVLGGWMLMRDNLGLELSVSNADKARVMAEDNQQNGGAMDSHPNASHTESERVRTLGEVGFNKARQQEAFTWISANHAAFVSLTLARLKLLLLPRAIRSYQTVFADTIVLLFYASLVLLWIRKRKQLAATLVAAIVGYELIYPFIQYDIRYVYPMLWVQTAGAATFIALMLKLDAEPLPS